MTNVLANRPMPAATVIPILAYPDVGEAVAWLGEGFAERWRAGDHRAQLMLAAGGAVVVRDRAAGPRPDAAEATHSVLVRVDDVDAHHEHAGVHGRGCDRRRTITLSANAGTPPRTLAVTSGRFSASIADVVPEACGGVSGPGL